MKEAIDGTNYFFVDESGDPTFYDKYGNLIVGHEGCSPVLILGLIETTDPVSLRHALAELHREIAADDYLKDVPSIAKTNIAFHAKNDVAEVREKMFKQIRALDFKAQFVVARKIERVFRNTFHANEGKFYDHLVAQLFENVLHRYTTNWIYISKRGSSIRQEPLESAVRAGVARFEEKWHTEVKTNFAVSIQTPVGEPCLQVVDYMNWAVYQAFVKRTMRYYKFIQDKVSLLIDLYDSSQYPKNWYNRSNPFDTEKISPM